ALHGKVAFSAFPTDVGKAEKVERLRLTFPSLLPVSLGPSSELNPARFLGVQLQPELPQSLLESFQNTIGFFLVLESEDAVFLINLVEDGRHGLLDQLVFQRRHAQRSLPSVGFRDIGSPRWLGSIRSAMDATVQILQPTFQPRLILLPGHAVYSGCRFSLHPIEAFPQPINAQMVEQGGELQLLVRLCCLPHTRQPLGHASPALRREHVELSSVLLDQRPSLPTLRKLAIRLCSNGSSVLCRCPTPPRRSHQPHGLGLRWPSCCPSGSAGIAEV